MRSWAPFLARGRGVIEYWLIRLLLGRYAIRNGGYTCGGELPSEYMQFTPMFHETRTLADAYRTAGIEPMDDDIGAISIIPFDFVSGLTVFSEGGDSKRYSLASHMPTLSMSSIRSGEPTWPKKKENAKDVTKREKIAILGGHPNWMQVASISDDTLAFALLQSGPSEVMERIIYGAHIRKRGFSVSVYQHEPADKQVHSSGRAGGPEYGKSAISFGRLPGEAHEELINAALGAEHPDPYDCERGCLESDVTSFFKDRAYQVFGPGRLEDLMSGIAASTRASYITEWNRCRQFALRTPHKRRITQVDPRWDDVLIDWVLFETRISGLQVSTTRSKISGLRYWHTLSGYPDWSKWAGRYKQLLRIVAKKDMIRRNYPFNLELMLRAKKNVTTCTEWQTLNKSDSRRLNDELFSAMRIGLFFLLRISEIECLRMRDVRIAQQEGESYLTVFIVGGNGSVQSRGASNV